ncbi:MAG: hypothetical protein LBC26_05880, partial [Oscillospiraceae bacterium]|nr:hypothetical protein [Oscillospiraceae bacterium]
MTRITKRTLRPAAAALALCLLLAAVCGGAPALAAEEVSLSVPAGQTEFTYALTVTEAEPYAGIEFGLALSDETALAFTSFTPGADIAGAAASPFVTAHGLHYFGFYTASNTFSGTQNVGTLHFTYIGSAPQTITLVDVKVVRLDAEGEPIGVQRPAPALILTVSRDEEPGDDPGDDHADDLDDDPDEDPDDDPDDDPDEDPADDPD